MNTYKIWFPFQGTYQQVPITIKAKKVAMDDTGQKIFYGESGDDIRAIASAETTVVLLTEVNENEYMKGFDK